MRDQQFLHSRKSDILLYIVSLTAIDSKSNHGCRAPNHRTVSSRVNSLCQLRSDRSIKCMQTLSAGTSRGAVVPVEIARLSREDATDVVTREQGADDREADS